VYDDGFHANHVQVRSLPASDHHTGTGGVTDTQGETHTHGERETDTQREKDTHTKTERRRETENEIFCRETEGDSEWIFCTFLRLLLTILPFLVTFLLKPVTWTCRRLNRPVHSRVTVPTCARLGSTQTLTSHHAAAVSFFSLPVQLTRICVKLFLSLICWSSKKLFNAGVNKLSVMAVRVGDSFNCRSDRTPKLNRNVMWDPGCNIVISNNKSDFIGPMVPYKTSLGLADANMSSMVTHKGTIRLNGKLVDALYGPTLNKTLVSGGWLFRLGYIPQHSWSGRKDIVDKKGDVWMSFHIAEDNLYYLVEENTRIVANSA
jgi:hypothetical protein